ncbi:MAG: hypothetical protein KDE32_11620 [Novosphingobium sp.]|nr:hypothetical protein [Novosphingobium sp.]
MPSKKTKSDRKNGPERQGRPKLTDAERHKRFKEMAKEVDADKDPDAFDRAFASIDPKAKSED